MSGSAHAPLADGWAVELEPVQLIAPEGTPTSETRFSRDLPPETLGVIYKTMVAAPDQEPPTPYRLAMWLNNLKQQK